MECKRPWAGFEGSSCVSAGEAGFLVMEAERERRRRREKEKDKREKRRGGRGGKVGWLSGHVFLSESKFPFRTSFLTKMRTSQRN